MKYYLSIAICVFACTFGASAQELRVGAPAPIFAGQSVDGGNYDLAQLRGQVVVVTFWSTRCLICKTEMPKVNQLIRGYAGKDVTFLALTSDDQAKVEDYLRKSPQEAHVIPNSFGALLAYADKDKDGNLNFGYPAFYVIDREGRVAYKGSGWDRTGQISSAVNNLLR